jgi:hypothetical protein
MEPYYEKELHLFLQRYRSKEDRYQFLSSVYKEITSPLSSRIGTVWVEIVANDHNRWYYQTTQNERGQVQEYCYTTEEEKIPERGVIRSFPVRCTTEHEQKAIMKEGVARQLNFYSPIFRVNKKALFEGTSVQGMVSSLEGDIYCVRGVNIFFDTPSPTGMNVYTNENYSCFSDTQSADQFLSGNSSQQLKFTVQLRHPEIIMIDKLGITTKHPEETAGIDGTYLPNGPQYPYVQKMEHRLRLAYQQAMQAK